LPDLRQLPVTPDERRQLGREVVRQRRVAERAQRRETGGQAVRVQLENALRAAEVLEPVDAEIGERRAGREPVPDQGGRRLRDQDLAAVRDAGQPGGAVDVQAHQAGHGSGGLAGVDAHPDPDVLPARPGVGRQGPLDIHRRGRAGSR
jgi:hypothetical protein